FILECRVNTACRDVCLLVFQALVSNKFNPLLRPLLLGVGLHRTTLPKPQPFCIKKINGLHKLNRITQQQNLIPPNPLK
ncbi:hypothetical protein ACVGW4_00840, partial [Enterobacter hormaechei]